MPVDRFTRYRSSPLGLLNAKGEGGDAFVTAGHRLKPLFAPRALAVFALAMQFKPF
jgi:hypothetical protein